MEVGGTGPGQGQCAEPELRPLLHSGALGLLGSRRLKLLGSTDGWGRHCALFPCLPTVSNRWRHEAVLSPQPVPNLGVGVSGVVVRAARDKGRLCDARSDRSRRFPDAGLC